MSRVPSVIPTQNPLAGAVESASPTVETTSAPLGRGIQVGTGAPAGVLVEPAKSANTVSIASSTEPAASYDSIPLPSLIEALAKDVAKFTGQSPEAAIQFASTFAPQFDYGAGLIATGDPAKVELGNRIIEHAKAQAIAYGGQMGLNLMQNQLQDLRGKLSGFVDALLTKYAPAAATVLGGPLAGIATAAAGAGIKAALNS